MPPSSAPWGEALRAVERWFLPPECLLCESPVDAGAGDALVCSLCRSRWHPIPDPVCARCGQPLEPELRCRLCAAWPERLRGIRSVVWLTGGARDAAHFLKYQGWWRVAEAMAEAMRPLVRAVPPEALLVPIPLGRRRERSRGYNQSAVIATAVARHWTRELATDRLWRRRDTVTQTGLAPDARLANVRGAFGARWPDGRPAILVDDVFTTGATLVAAAEALLAAGAPWVGGVTFARARRPLDDDFEDLPPGRGS